MKFSIIVPIYNAQATLKRCLDSILVQDYTDYEVLMIDDGSSDNSVEIALFYAKMDSRFILLQQPNSGPSKARNYGLDESSGEIITFVDSDDYVECDYLQVIFDSFQKTDIQILFFGVNQIDCSSGKKIRQRIPELLNDKNEQIISLTKADMFGYTFIKAFSRSIIGQTRFDESLNLYEDEVFTCEIMSKLPSISCVNRYLYNQVISPGSLSRRVHRDYYMKCEAVYIAWKRLLVSMNIPNHSISTEKANHMAKVCKYYYLEKRVSSMRFAKGLAKCSFFRDSTVDDVLINEIKNEKFVVAQVRRFLYRAKTFLHIVLGR